MINLCGFLGHAFPDEGTFFLRSQAYLELSDVEMYILIKSLKEFVCRKLDISFVVKEWSGNPYVVCRWTRK